MRFSSTFLVLSLALGLSVTGAPLTTRPTTVNSVRDGINAVSIGDHVLVPRQGRRPAAKAVRPPAKAAVRPPATAARPQAKGGKVATPPAKAGTAVAPPATAGKAGAPPAKAGKAAASCALARKVGPRGLVSRAFAGGGIEICGIPARLNSAIDVCRSNAKRFGMVNNVLTVLTQTVGTDTVGVAGEAFDCDHAFELQIAKETLAADGACAALDGMFAAAGIQGAQEKQDFLEPILLALNGKDNLFSLSKDVNGQKGKMVSQGVKLVGATLPANSQRVNIDAVQAYFADAGIQAATAALGARLDTAVLTAVNAVQARAECAINTAAGDRPTSRQRAKRDADLQRVTVARAKFTTSKLRVAYQRVQTFINTQ